MKLFKLKNININLCFWTYCLTLIGVCMLVPGCKDFVEIDAPKDQIVNEKIYSSDEAAISAIRGIYAQMISTVGFASGGTSSVTLFAGRSADEFTNYTSSDLSVQFSTNNILPGNGFLKSRLWQEPYKYIYFANLILENLALSNGVSVSVRRQLEGEAKFIRAFCHFYLTNLFGEIPYILTTDYRINSLAFANTKTEIYKFLIKDLTDAKVQLVENYPSIERVRANKWAATAFLARVYLYNQEWENAENEASEVIAQGNLYKINDDLNTVFLKNSLETILQFAAPLTLGINTSEGGIFILTSAPGESTQVVLSNDFIKSFESGDKRFTEWVGKFTSGTSSWYYPFKYKIKKGATPSVEYSMVLRFAEQYLIRAEARIQQDKVASGISDLNVLRTRSRSQATILVPDPLPALSSTLAKADALLAVEKERKIELFSEWGHRWLDLKRTGRADAVLGLIKAPNWQSTDVLYPIPETELLNAINLNQNLGYQ